MSLWGRRLLEGLPGLGGLAVMAAAVGYGACAQGTSDPGAEGGTAPTTTTAGAGGAAGAAGAPSGGAGGSGGAPCPGDPCTLVLPQCGCGPSERCNWDWGFVCVPDGTAESGEVCDGDCVAGYRCMDNHTGGPKICHKYCEDDDDCFGPGALCVVPFGSPDYRLCSHNCDPMTDTGCAEPTMKCDIYREPDPPNRSFTQCSGAGSMGQDEACLTTSDCAPGLSCFGIDGQTGKWCMTWCLIGATITNCPSGTTCVPFTSPIVIGTTEYGACSSQ